MHLSFVSFYTSLLLVSVLIASVLYEGRTLLGQYDLKRQVPWWLYPANIIAWIRILILGSSLVMAVIRGDFYGRFYLREAFESTPRSSFFLHGPLISSACVITAWLDQIDGTIARDSGDSSRGRLNTLAFWLISNN